MSKAVSALAGASSSGFAPVRDLGLLGMVSLRADLSDAAVRDALEGVGVAVPDIRQITRGAVMTAWMAPDEMLVVTEYTSAPAWAAKAQEALAYSHALVAPVSDARACFEITGEAAPEVIAKLCPIDVEQLAPNEMRRTRIAQVAAAVWREDAERLRVICFRSVAGYVFDALSMAARPGTEVFGAKASRRR